MGMELFIGDLDENGKVKVIQCQHCTKEFYSHRAFSRHRAGYHHLPHGKKHQHVVTTKDYGV
jgi:hypothetical protein